MARSLIPLIARKLADTVLEQVRQNHHAAISELQRLVAKQLETNETLLGLIGGGGGGVPTTRLLTALSPITGGGDLSADRVFDFDETVAIGNNARVTVRKNTGVDVGARRRLNLIEGANITLTVADDPGNEEVDVIVAATGGGSADIKAATLTLGATAKREHKIAVTDAAVTGASQIMVSWGTTLDADANGPDMDDVSFAARPGTGTFDVLVVAKDPISGNLKINYLVG